MLYLAAALAFAIGVAHSWLGERFILIRLFRRPLPHLLGGEAFTRQTLRWAWHATSLVWWGFGALLVAVEAGWPLRDAILLSTAAVFGISAILPIVATRGRHLSWIVFGAIALICLWSYAT